MCAIFWWFWLLLLGWLSFNGLDASSCNIGFKISATTSCAILSNASIFLERTFSREAVPNLLTLLKKF